LNSPNDPRVFFAAERTLLAWLRTGIAVMGVGFVVARFSLFLGMVRHDFPVQAPHPVSTALGLSFVLFGAAGIAIAAWQFQSFLNTLGPSDRPPGYWLRASMWYALVMAGLGVLLAVYLASGVSAPANG
jgi:putative membrane protein